MPEPRLRGALGGIRDSLVIGAGYTLVVALGLTLLLAIRNPSVRHPGALLELTVILSWVALLINFGFLLGLTLIFPVALRLLPWWLSGHRRAFLVSGCFAMHVSWTMAHRFQPLQQLILAERFVTTTGLLQLLLIGLVWATLLAAGIGIARHRARGDGWMRALVPLSIATVLVVGGLAWNAALERGAVRYGADRLERLSGAEAGDASSGAPLILLGMDGLSWDVLVPLLEAGRLPAFARFIDRGTIGYLDNGNDSYSPRIWNTIYTGRPVAEHGILGFLKLHLPRSGVSLDDLLLQRPSHDSFYGLRLMLRRLPRMGLWQWASTRSFDLRAKRIWDVASDYRRRVVVAGVLTNRPLLPVNGEAIEFDLPLRAGSTDRVRASDRTLDQWRVALAEEVATTIELFREQRIDAGFYYTRVVDDLAHATWKTVAAPGMIRPSPDALPDSAWEELVRSRAGDPIFGGYALLDEALASFVRAFPEATFLICSDHGWTWSGYAHHGSPEGVILLAGGPVRSGEVLDEARVEDLAPTSLALLGIPVADDLQGNVLTDALTHSPETGRVSSYGPPPWGRSESGEEEPDEELLRRLEGLGYIR